MIVDDEREPIEALITRSSLGEPVARLLRRATPDYMVRAICKAEEENRGFSRKSRPKGDSHREDEARAMKFELPPLPSRYRFLDHLGHGGFAVVCRAHDLATNEIVAIKILRRTDADSRTRFAREARTLRDQINNVFVVDVVEFCDGEFPMLVMEYCKHGSLRRRVGQVDWWEATAILAHAVQGLHGVHRAGGFHRDVKPDNLLATELEGQWIIKLADFGVARVPCTGTFPMTRSAFGTTEYLPPEVVAGHPFTAAGDIYALGITLVELMTAYRSVRALDLIDGAPNEFVAHLRAMLGQDPHLRPTCPEIAAVVSELRQPAPAGPNARPMVSGARSPVPESGDVLRILGLVGAAGLVGAGLLALAVRDDRTWDARVQRHRRSDGTFAPA